MKDISTRFNRFTHIFFHEAITFQFCYKGDQENDDMSLVRLSDKTTKVIVNNTELLLDARNGDCLQRATQYN
jgi:hypothetical protein